MIFSSIKVKQSMPYPKAIQTALDYLKSNDFTKMEPGVYEIQGKDIYAQVFDAETFTPEKLRPEVHEKYVDVQFLASGEECLGFTPDYGLYEVDEKFNERDLTFYKDDADEGIIKSRPGCFCIFFPEDVHRPAMICKESMKIRKVVVKVKVSLLK